MMIYNKIVFFLCLFLTHAYADGIATGSETGTYFQIGKDIHKECSDKLDLKVYLSDGSLYNYKLLRNDKNIQYAIMQYDVLKYMKKIKHKDYKQIKILYPLYDEEIHVIVNKNLHVNKLSDLNGKRVSIGEKNSGTWVTSNLLIEDGSLSWITSEMDGRDAIKAIVNGNLDAVIIIAGAPTKLLTKLPTEASEYLKIVNLSDTLLDNRYQKNTIKKNIYKFNSSEVNTYGVKSVLVTYNYTSSHSISKMKKLYSCIDDNLWKLKKSGHSKWKEVSFRNMKYIDWPVHSKITALRKDKARKLAKKSKAIKTTMVKQKTIKHNGDIYKTIKSPYTGKIWLDRNLGASRVCTSYNDEMCYGDYFQWGRSADGHEKRNSQMTSTLSSGNKPNHNRFIRNNKFWHNWMKKQDDSLWQGSNGKNNPCPIGFKIPTKNELANETTKQNVRNNKDAYRNFLKIPSAGLRYKKRVIYKGSKIYMNTSSVYRKYSVEFKVDESKAELCKLGTRTDGESVRCIKR